MGVDMVTVGCRVSDNLGERGEGTVTAYAFDILRRDWFCLVTWDAGDPSEVARLRVTCVDGNPVL